MWQALKQELITGSVKALARCISLVENEAVGYRDFLSGLPVSSVPIIGITGPPGAGKSTLTDGLIHAMVHAGKKVAVLCVDPSSPFNLGAVLGDRIRMSQWYDHPLVYIRSLATRGSMGGLHPKILEITEICKAAAFDFIIVETVGVGQSEIEITGLADVTVVVLVPEAGDEIQTMKAGLMEIADIFVVNKADRPDAQLFVKHLHTMLAPAFHKKNTEIPILQTIALKRQGLDELWHKINSYLASPVYNEQKSRLLAERMYYMIEKERMKDIRKEDLKNAIEPHLRDVNFNVFRFVESYMDSIRKNPHE
ncbi:MAG: methylmalonyl Co-A mutase-associated GTPase MeaB [Bacteroidota bacterium]|jgi:LAO/AO transport system kinase